MLGGLAIDFAGLGAVKMMFLVSRRQWRARPTSHLAGHPAEQQPACHGRTRKLCSLADSEMDHVRCHERRDGGHAGELSAGTLGSRRSLAKQHR